MDGRRRFRKMGRKRKDGWTFWGELCYDRSLIFCLVHPYSDLDSRGGMQNARYLHLNTELIGDPMSIQMKK